MIVDALKLVSIGSIFHDTQIYLEFVWIGTPAKKSKSAENPIPTKYTLKVQILILKSKPVLIIKTFYINQFKTLNIYK